MPQRGASNEYPQQIFVENKKNIMWISPLICSYVYPTISPDFVGRLKALIRLQTCTDVPGP